MKTTIMKLFLGLGLLSASVQASTQSVWQHHIDAWNERNLAKIASDYDDNSILIINNKIFKGRKEVEKAFAELFKIFDEGNNRIDTPIVKDRIVYITWHFTQKGQKNEVYGTDTFIIEKDKIKVQTIASPLYEGKALLK